MTAFHPNQLNCDTALQRLESVWLDPLPDEPLDAELSAAWEHVQECSACWATFQQRRDNDLRLAEVMQAVPVPSGLKEQLIAQLAETSCATIASAEPSAATKEVATAVTTVTQVPVLNRVTQLRRRVWAITTAAALLVCAAGGSWLWFAAQPRLVSMQTLCHVTPLASSGLPVASSVSSLPPLPQSWLGTKVLRIVESPRWFTPPNSKTAAAWIPFEATLSRKLVIRGVLLAVPRDSVLDPPAELIGPATRLGYTQRDGLPLSIAGWSERGVVYVCFVRGEPASLDQLLKLTAPTAV